jgi:SAM-dependent methyltransferase
MSTTMYQTGEYLDKNPSWHVEDSPWKAVQILRMLERNRIQPSSVCDVGCGAGAVLEHLQKASPPDVYFYGYEVSPQAFRMCQSRVNERLRFVLGDISSTRDRCERFDLLLMMDVVEHVEAPFELLRTVRPLGKHKMFHFPLDLSAQGVLRGVPSKVRRTAGHIHYFTKELVLQTLEDTGYRVVDYFYTQGAIELQSGSRLIKLPRRLLFSISPEMAALCLGGFSLLVLAI